MCVYKFKDICVYIYIYICIPHSCKSLNHQSLYSCHSENYLHPSPDSPSDFHISMPPLAWLPCVLRTYLWPRSTGRAECTAAMKSFKTIRHFTRPRTKAKGETDRPRIQDTRIPRHTTYKIQFTLQRYKLQHQHIQHTNIQQQTTNTPETQIP